MLTEGQLASFEEDGYLVVPGVFDAEQDFGPVYAEYGRVLDGLVDELVRTGSLVDAYSDLDFEARLTSVYAESGRVFAQHFDFSLPQGPVTLETPIHNGPAVFGLLRHPRLLDVVEGIVGPEIYLNPVHHVRIKPPERLVPDDANTRATVWHQDNGVVTPDADETETLTVWFPVKDVSEEMGCLVVVPGSHRAGLLPHCPSGKGNVSEVPAKFFHPEDGVALPMKKGSVLLMHRRLLHRSLPNASDRARWSFDLRYHKVGEPTGRDAFPGFVARSRRNPQTELHDSVVWAELWGEARRALAVGDVPRFNRWSGDSAACA